MKHIFLVGAKGIGFYGGYESFVQKLLEYHRDETEIKYHVACKANGEGAMKVDKLPGASEVKDGKFTFYNAECFLVKVPEKLGPAQAVAYDISALRASIKEIRDNRIQDAVVYVMACRIGPFFRKYVKKLHKLGARVYLNPDGHEWKRAKWSGPIRKYWKESEKLMVKYSDLIISDSINIEKYVQEEYRAFQPKTTFIAYGAETKKSILKDNAPKYRDWLNYNGLHDGEYYISVGRFVPENNFETMIREFMKSKTSKDFAVIATKNEKFLEELEERLHYRKDPRIKFVGTVYDTELLQKIRENAYGYFHGHSVGGTNPSLLEALGATKLNLLYDIGFNREVAEDAALYWSLEEGDLAKLIDSADSLSEEERTALGEKAKKRIREAYSWEYISQRYYDVFTA